MEARHKAILQMLLFAAMGSTAGIFIKLIPWSPFAIAGWRSLIAAGTVLTFLLVKEIKFKFSGRAALNGLFMCLTFFTFIAANKLTTAANTIVLQFTSPVFIMVFSAVLFKKKFRRADFMVVFFTLSGMALFFLDQLKPGYLIGNCLAILSGALMAGVYLSIGSADEETKMGGIVLGHLFTAAIGVTASFIIPTQVTLASGLCIAALGILQVGIPFILLAYSSKYCPPLACALLGALEPLLNPVWVFLFTGEAPGLFALLGGAVVIASVTWWCIRQDRRASEETPG